jgi:restriction system protein
MTNYSRVMAGARSVHLKECLDGNFIGVDYGIPQDLSQSLTDNWREFNTKFIPIYLSIRPDRTKIAAGLACGCIWTVSKGLRSGDVVITPDGTGRYHAGEIIGDYFYAAGQVLPHRRQIRWFPETFAREQMSESLRRSTNATGTCCDITRYSAELQGLINHLPLTTVLGGDSALEDATSFALEKHLEDFLVANWAQTELGKLYNIYAEDGEIVGQQYPTDTGPMDILAVSKDKKDLLVVELKKGRASDAVVGQIQRYMGYVLDVLAEPDQKVSGVIIAFEDDLRIRRALRVAQNIRFYRYQINFTLIPATGI